MKIANFSLADPDPLRPSGTCEAGGHPAHCFFDRSGPSLAWITLRFSMQEGAQLPGVAQGVTGLEIDGHPVPVRVAKLKCGAQALQGSIDPALVEAVAGPVPDPFGPGEPPADHPAPPEPPEHPADPPAGEGGPSADPAPDSPGPGDDDDQLVALSRQHAAAKRERKQHADRVKDLRSETADLRERLEAAEAELAIAGDTAAAHAERCAELRQRVRDALDAEEG